MMSVMRRGSVGDIGASGDAARTGATGAPAPPASPPAVRGTRARWRDPRLAVGIAVVAGCALLGGKLLAASDDTVGVWAARASLAEGQEVGTADVVRREVRFADQADADHYLSADQPLPDDAEVGRPVGAGELLPRTALGTGDTGSRTEVPLSVGADAVPATVHVGSVVDVWVTAEKGARSTLVFDDVPVLATPRSADSLGPTTTRQVIVGVGQAQQAALPRSIAALGGGDVLLTVRR